MANRYLSPTAPTKRLLILPTKAIQYSVHPGMLDESYADGKGRVRVQYDVTWADRWDFCLFWLGYSEVSQLGTSGPKYVSRVTPQPYRGSVAETRPGTDQDSSQFWLWATAVEKIEGHSPAGIDVVTGAPLFEFARITIVYESLTYRIVTDQEMVLKGKVANGVIDESTLCRNVTRVVHPTAEYLTLGFGRYRWAEGATPPKGNFLTGANIGITVPSQEVVYTWHQVPRSKPRSDAGPPSYAVPEAAKKAIGTVNKYDFDFNTDGTPKFPAGTLLLTAIEVKPYRWIHNYYYSDVTYKMRYFNAVRPGTFPPEHYATPKGHNYFLYTPQPQENNNFQNYDYYLLTHDGEPTGIKVYQESDFKDLFRPD